MTENQLNTFLGNFWEQVVSDQLDKTGVTYERSPDLGPGIISPDFVCRHDRTTIFVTCTGSSQSFIKKRWRYINELFQAKGALGDDMLVANLVLATNANLQEFEQTVFRKLFDIAAFGDEFSDFERLNLWARAEISSGSDVQSLANEFLFLPDAERFRVSLTNWLNLVFEDTPRKLGGLWAEVRRYQSKRVLNAILPHGVTYWRRACLKLLPLTLDEREDVFRGLAGKTVQSEPERMEKTGIQATRRIGGVRLSDTDIATTLKTFNKLEFDQTLKLLDADNSEIRFPLEEVVDSSAVATAFRNYKSAFSSKNAMSAKALEEFSSGNSTRIRIWDYAVALANTSLLDINKEYVRKWGKIGVANPINNVLLKTDIGMSISRSADIAEVINRVSSILWQRLPRTIKESFFLEKVMGYRKRSLFLQPYLNPTQRYFENVCRKVLGACNVTESFDGLLGDLGIKGRASRIESLYVFRFNGIIWLFKVLAGYKGGYEHKADEMASRAWLLRFRIETLSGRAYTAPVHLVFVYEGEWDEKYLSLLHSSGWDDVVHLSKIGDFLKKVTA